MTIQDISDYSVQLLLRWGKIAVTASQGRATSPYVSEVGVHVVFVWMLKKLMVNYTDGRRQSL